MVPRRALPPGCCIGDQAKPGGQLPAVAKVDRGTRCGHHGVGGDRSDAHDRVQLDAACILLRAIIALMNVGERLAFCTSVRTLPLIAGGQLSEPYPIRLLHIMF